MHSAAGSQRAIIATFVMAIQGLVLGCGFVMVSSRRQVFDRAGPSWSGPGCLPNALQIRGLFAIHVTDSAST